MAASSRDRPYSDALAAAIQLVFPDCRMEKAQTLGAALSDLVYEAAPGADSRVADVAGASAQGRAGVDKLRNNQWLSDLNRGAGPF